MSLRGRNLRPVACAIVADSPAGGELICSLLEDVFQDLQVVEPDNALPALQQRAGLGVLVLALQEIDAAEAFLREFNASWDGKKAAPQQVLFCGRESVMRAYELCRELSVSDYVVFWPVSLDPRRVLMSAHRACDSYLAEIERRRAEDPESEPAPPQRITDIAPDDSHITPGAASVLVVEDDEFQQQLVIRMLQDEGYAATGVAGGAAALELLKGFRPSLILLDVDMPEMDGIALLQLLKMDVGTASTPVIMLTSMNRREVVIDARRAGAADFIAKPFARELLLAKVEAVLHLARA